MGEVRLLGPIEVHGPDGRAALNGARQRTLVAVLALNAGTVVAADRLIDVLWGDDPPRTALKSLQSHVARVRQALADCGMPGALIYREPGYQLNASVDALRFEQAATDPAQVRAALALWRGDPLADGEVFGWGVAEIDRLREVRLTALESLWQAEITSGRHTEAVPELSRLLVSHPLRERLVGLLMLALHRGDRHTDALEAYQQLRIRLADELGVDPSPDLTKLHTAILRRDPSLLGARPAELPARAGHFTARLAELAALDPDGPSIVVICGAAGVGKTSLAVEWAHRVASRFPDGQLFVEVGDTDPLAHILHALGSDGPAQPSLYRSLVHGKRFLIVLDNARTARDVLPLVPGDPRTLLLVTSRDSLAALNAHHAVRTIHLDVLSPSDSLALLAGVIGSSRVSAEPTAAADLVLRCGHLPLALRIAAAKLAARPRRLIASLVAELDAADPLDVLAVEGRSVRAVFTSAYRALSSDAARLFRQLSLHPGTTFAGHLASGPGLDELLDAHLVEEVVSGRYGFHDLVRLFARACGEEDVSFLLDWYLAVAYAANKVLTRTHFRVVRPDVPVPFGTDRASVLAYLDAERDNMIPIVRLAARHSRHEATWQLTYLLTSYFEARGNWAARVELCELAVEAARELGDQGVEAEMLRALGVAYFMTRQLTEAIEVQRKALVLVDGDPQSEGRLHNNIGNAYAELRRFEPALDSFQRAIEFHREAGDDAGVALSQRNLGYTCIRIGQTDLGIEHLNAALATFRATDSQRMEAATLNTLGTAYRQQGELTRALDHFGKALHIGRAIGDQRFEADALTDLGVTQLAKCDLGAARASFDEALQVCGDLADRFREATVLHHLGHVELRAGELAQARTHLVLAAETHPDPFERGQVHRTLGEVEARAGEWVEAARHWAQAVELLRSAHAARVSEST